MQIYQKRSDSKISADNRWSRSGTVKKTYSFRKGKTLIKREYSYIPVRYVVAALLAVLEVATIIGIVIAFYLIIDNELCQSIENAALRGVDVRIIVPHIPDKKLIFGMTRSFYHRLMKASVRIYEYTPGFIHAKSYIADDKCAMIGTINLDYRSLVHHFENGVWMYECDSIAALKADIDDTLKKSMEIKPDMLKTGLLTRFVRSVVRIFAPML